MQLFALQEEAAKKARGCWVVVLYSEPLSVVLSFHWLSLSPIHFCTGVGYTKQWHMCTFGRKAASVQLDAEPAGEAGFWSPGSRGAEPLAAPRPPAPPTRPTAARSRAAPWQARLGVTARARTLFPSSHLKVSFPGWPTLQGWWMFFISKISKGMALAAKDMGRNLDATVKTRLIESVEGSVFDKEYIVAVLDVKDSWRGSGVLDDFTGDIKYVVEFEALVLRPIMYEVVDAVVHYVTHVGFYCMVGPLQIFVSRNFLGDDMEYNMEQMSFSSRSNATMEIKKNYGVRVRVIGILYGAQKITCVGSIGAAFTGVVNRGFQV